MWSRFANDLHVVLDRADHQKRFGALGEHFFPLFFSVTSAKPYIIVFLWTTLESQIWAASVRRVLHRLFQFRIPPPFSAQSRVRIYIFDVHNVWFSVFHPASRASSHPVCQDEQIPFPPKYFYPASLHKKYCYSISCLNLYSHSASRKTSTGPSLNAKPL